MLPTTLRGLIIAAAVAFLIRLVTKWWVVKGNILGLVLATILFVSTSAAISFACAFVAAERFGPAALNWWFGLSAVIAYFFIQRAQFRKAGGVSTSVKIGGNIEMRQPRHVQQEDWFTSELAFIDLMTGGGIMLGAMAAIAARFMKLV